VSAVSRTPRRGHAAGTHDGDGRLRVVLLVLLALVVGALAGHTLWPPDPLAEVRAVIPALSNRCEAPPWLTGGSGLSTTPWHHEDTRRSQLVFRRQGDRAELRVLYDGLSDDSVEAEETRYTLRWSPERNAWTVEGCEAVVLSCYRDWRPPCS
jgi:hypothetical protein